MLLTYENEVFLTNEIYGDKALPCIVPKHNIRIECPLSPVDKVLEPRGPAVKKAADDFCRWGGLTGLAGLAGLAAWMCGWMHTVVAAMQVTALHSCDQVSHQPY